jgi:predicted small secreted protein
MQRVLGLGAVLAVTAVLAAGCGGGGEESPAEQWASGVCTSIATWKTEVAEITTDAADALKQPATARKTLEAAVDDGLQATKTLIAELKDLEPPDTPEGQQAKTEIDAFLATVESTADEVETTLAGLSDAGSLSAIVESLSGLSLGLQTTIQEGRELVTTLQGVGGDIKDGFESAAACDDLRDAS